MEHSNDNNAEPRICVTINEEDTEGCRMLWLSVIIQNISDGICKSKNSPFRQRREEALEWLAAEEGEGSDFAIVCDLAGIDFKKASKRVNQFVSGEIQSIDFRCLRQMNRPSVEQAGQVQNMPRQRSNLRGSQNDFIVTPASFVGSPPVIKTKKQRSWREALVKPAA